jgi:hypothetical protein
MGDALKVSMETTLVLTLLIRKIGKQYSLATCPRFGDFYRKDKYLLLKTPFSQ